MSLSQTIVFDKAAFSIKHNNLGHRNNLSFIQIEIYECMVSSWDEHDTFDSDQLPFFIEMFPLMQNNTKYVGLDLRIQYIEFMEAR